MFPRVFTLYRGHHARRREISRADVRYADLVVYYPYHLYYGDGALYPEDRGDFLGVSPHMVNQLGDLSDLLLESRLVAQLRKKIDVKSQSALRIWLYNFEKK